MSPIYSKTKILSNLNYFTKRVKIALYYKNITTYISTSYTLQISISLIHPISFPPNKLVALNKYAWQEKSSRRNPSYARKTRQKPSNGHSRPSQRRKIKHIQSLGKPKHPSLKLPLLYNRPQCSPSSNSRQTVRLFSQHVQPQKPSSSRLKNSGHCRSSSRSFLRCRFRKQLFISHQLSRRDFPCN